MVEFIYQGPNNRTLSASDRRLVRKFSTTAAAATRKSKGPKAKVNTLQLPDFLIINETETTPASKSSEEAGRNTDAREGPLYPLHVAGVTGIPSSADFVADTAFLSIPLPLSLWPSSKNSPEHVSLLTQPGLSQKLLTDASSVGVNSDPRRWTKICRLSSVLHFLPRMIGHSKCLDYAIDCLAERVRQSCLTSPDTTLARTQLEKRYGRSLQCLQTALDASDRIDWTVWYTTLLLALFELLEDSNHHAWILHSQGAKHILLNLGPYNIRSEYEKILLAAQCQIMVTEALFTNDVCFLDNSSWQKALFSTIDQDSKFPDRSEPVIAMWAITAYAPSLFKQATEAILGGSSGAEKVSRIANSLRILLDRYVQWREKWEAKLLRGNDILQQYSSSNTAITSATTLSSPGTLSPAEATASKAGPTIFPQYLAFYALTLRFLFALQPYSGTALHVEFNAVTTSLQVLEFDARDSVTDLCRSSSVSIARSIRDTSAEWTAMATQREVDPPIEEERERREETTIDPDMFRRWMALWSRAVG